jgi:hypothetical protein
MRRLTLSRDRNILFPAKCSPAPKLVILGKQGITTTIKAESSPSGTLGTWRPPRTHGQQWSWGANALPGAGRARPQVSRMSPTESLVASSETNGCTVNTKLLTEKRAGKCVLGTLAFQLAPNSTPRLGARGDMRPAPRFPLPSSMHTRYASKPSLRPCLLPVCSLMPRIPTSIPHPRVQAQTKSQSTKSQTPQAGGFTGTGRCSR